MKLYRPSLERLNELKRFLRHNRFYGCHMTLANSVMWWSRYDTYYTTVADMLVFCSVKDDKPVAFTFPVGAADAKQAFDAIVSYFEKNGLPVRLYLVEPAAFELIEQWYPGEYIWTKQQEDSDYIYEAEALASLSGKKLHGKRNHIHRFTEAYPHYVCEPVSEKNSEECLFIAKEWADRKLADSGLSAEEISGMSEDYRYEFSAIRTAIENQESLQIRGMLLRIEGRAIAFTLGSPLNKETFDIHFEKVCGDIQGAYAMINREFAKALVRKYRLINREEDLGIPGLRQAKLSYHPFCVLEKGTVTRK